MLVKGADWFVDGAAGIAAKLKIPQLVIGLTIVAMGTSAPETAVSMTAAFKGNAGISVGNVIGSNIMNVLVILGLSAVITSIAVAKTTVRYEIPIMLAITFRLLVFGMTGGQLVLWEGIVLLLCFVVYMVMNVINMKKNPSEEEHEENLEISEGEENAKGGLVKDIVMLVVSAAVIAVGAKLLVEGATKIAHDFNVPETIISLTIVALGTSLPELVTAVTALMKGHGALTLGNIIGANIFNLVLVSGAAITINPFEVPAEATFLGNNASFIFDIPLVFIVMGIMTIPTIIKGKLQRWQGISLLAIYAAYCVLQFVILPNFA